MDDAFKGVYRPDRVQFYRTQATNSQIGDLLRHEDELIAEVNRLRKENAAMLDLARRVVEANTMSEWGIAGLADTARAILAAHSKAL